MSKWKSFTEENLNYLKKEYWIFFILVVNFVRLSLCNNQGGVCIQYSVSFFRLASHRGCPLYVSGNRCPFKSKPFLLVFGIFKSGSQHIGGFRHSSQLVVSLYVSYSLSCCTYGTVVCVM